MNSSRIASASREPTTGKVPLPGNWALRAACRGKPTAWWYPGEGHLKATTGWARAICAGCPVAAECLDHALRYRELGIWAGTDRDERRRMRWTAWKRAQRPRERVTV